MATINNNKESFQLLRGSSDSNSASEVSELVFPPRKKRFRRRLRNNPSTKHEEMHNDCRCRARTVSLTLFCIVLICWLITLTWLAVVLHNELYRLNSEVSKVVAGSQGVPDALQKCHSLSRDLQKNQSQIMDRLSEFSALHSNFTSEIAEVKNVLRTVQDQLKSSPDLVNVPQSVETLSKQVATFGSKIADLGETVSTIKDQYGGMDASVKNLVTNVTEMRVRLTNMSNANNEKSSFTDKEFAQEKEDILLRINQVSANLSTVNDTLSNKLRWTAEDRSTDHKLIESLREMNENVTARVKTLEGLCAKESEPPKLDLKGNPTPLTMFSPSPPGIQTTSQFSSESKKSENPP